MSGEESVVEIAINPEDLEVYDEVLDPNFIPSDEGIYVWLI